jgi:protein-tyrosine phosphatase
MLTRKGYEQRKWREFPSLRKAIDGKPIPDSLRGFTSIDDTILDQLPRLFTIAVTTADNPAAIRNAARLCGWEGMHRDLDRLADTVERLARDLIDASHGVRRLHELARPSPGPIADSYWLIDDLLLAGEYPGAAGEDDTRIKLTKFLDAGIRTFIDLTEVEEPLTKYDSCLRTLSRERAVDAKYFRRAIPDAGLPGDRQLMADILDTIREETAAGRPVYVHCWGGIGRTGTVIGCWLVEQGLTGREAIERLAEIRRGTPDGYRASPETPEQCQFILGWTPRANTRIESE